MVEPEHEIVTEYVTWTFAEHMAIVHYLHRLWFLLFGLIAFAGVFVFMLAEPPFKPIGGALVVMGIGNYLYIRWHYRRLWNDPKAKLTRDPTRARITKDKLIFESQGGTKSEVPWTSLRGIEKNKDDYYLFVTRVSAIIMLKRAQSPEDWIRFSALADSWRQRLSAKD